MKNRTYINLELLTQRNALLPESFKTYEKEKAGDEGEKAVNEILSQTFGAQNYLKNVLLLFEGSYFQIDHLVATEDRIVIFDTKNFSCDFEVNDGTWKFTDGKTISSPILQIDRSKELLKKWTQKHNIYKPIWGFVIWYGEGHIYGLKNDGTVIGMNKFKRIIDKIKNKEEISQDVNQVIHSNRIIKSPFYQAQAIPVDIHGGLNCPTCFHMNFTGKREKYCCLTCGDIFSAKDLIYQNVLYYCSLYDVESFTVDDMIKFIDTEFSRKTLNRAFNDLVSDNKIRKVKRGLYSITRNIEVLL